ncbi:hypothetical protein [Streptomyces sp. NPDC001889]
MKSDHVVFDRGQPIEHRIGRLVTLWTGDGRGPDHLVTGRAFHAVYCRHLRHGTDHGIAWAEYVTAAYDAIGGDEGWNVMLRARDVCESCGDTYRLENIGLCTGCMEYTCYSCRGHGSCAGEIV